MLLLIFKGDIVFWYNLHRNGDGNANTEHASCPVVSGSKWGKRFVC